ncbi:MAG: peptidase [Myxococcales bacterium]|nr:peptidase [Myxococcales bacterium]
MLVAGLAACEQRQPPVDRRPTPASPSRSAVLLPCGRSIADVAEQVTPSVVSVVSVKAGQLGQHEYSVGSGVILSSDGVVITNSHVVDQAAKIAVGLKDGRALEGRLVGADPKSDIALVRIDSKNLKPIAIADSSKLRIGDVVIAVGNPFGIGQTVTMGIVSAVSRVDLGITDYDDFIQTDAAINPGSSGGALVNMDGELIGINTAIVSRNGAYQGIAFAIPSRMAIQIKNALLEHGKVIRGWLGVAVEDVTYEHAQSLHLERGVLVASVTPNGPAAKAGLEQGDVITAIDGVEMRDAGQVRNLVAMTATGKTVQVDLRRNGKPTSVAVSLAEQPDDLRTASPFDRDAADPERPSATSL